MSELDSPQLKTYANEHLRVIADRLAALDDDVVDATAIYYARDLGTYIDGAGASNLIADGSETDGRTRCTGGDVYNFVTLLSDLTTFLAANNRRDVIAKWFTNRRA